MNRPSIIDLDETSLSALSQDDAIANIRELVAYVRHLENAQERSSTTPKPSSTSEADTGVVAADSSASPANSTKTSSNNSGVKPSSGSVAGGKSSGSKTSPSGVSTTTTSEDHRLRQQQQEASRRENVLVMRLTAKEQEVQEYLNKLEEMRMNGASIGRSVLLDPAVNVIFQRMRQELKKARDEMEQTRQELNAWQFTPDSNTGKRLMARCHTLFQENQELGQLCSSGRVAKLEGDLAMMTKHCKELRDSQAEVDDFLLELDAEMEGSQSTIIFLQGLLKKSQLENHRLRELAGLGFDGTLDEELARKQDERVKMEMEESSPVQEVNEGDQSMVIDDRKMSGQLVVIGDQPGMIDDENVIDQSEIISDQARMEVGIGQSMDDQQIPDQSEMIMTASPKSTTTDPEQIDH